MPLPFLRLYYIVNLCIKYIYVKGRHIVDVEYLLKSERIFISMCLLRSVRFVDAYNKSNNAIKCTFYKCMHVCRSV